MKISQFATEVGGTDDARLGPLDISPVDFQCFDDWWVERLNEGGKNLHEKFRDLIYHFIPDIAWRLTTRSYYFLFLATWL